MNNKNVLALIIIALCTLCLLTGVVATTQKNADSAKAEKTKQTIKENFMSRNKIALLKLDGVIDSSTQSSLFTPSTSAQSIIDALKEIRKDSSIKGVIIKINSPGGTVGMSQNVYDAIIETRKMKPVVVAMDDIAASGGYYIASAADRIFSQRGTLTGSIGVIFSSVDMHQLLSDKLLIKPNVIKSGKYKDVGSAMKAMSDDDRQLLQEIINDSYKQFIADITAGRIKRNDLYSVAKKDLTAENLSKYADGRVFTGQQALSYGFVDGLGDINVAHKATMQMAKEKFKIKDKEIPLVPYNKYSNFSEIFIGASEALFKKKPSVLEEYLPMSIRMGRQPLYLWE